MTSKTPKLDDGPALRTIAMPADTNPRGDIFGGWLLAQMDLAGSSLAIREAANPRVATVGIEAMQFHQPVFVGDEVSFYATVKRIGRTSIAIQVDSWAVRRGTTEGVKVTEGVFTYVALDENRRPIPVKQGSAAD